MIGLFRLVAFSKAKNDKDAYSLPPMSTLIVSDDLLTTMPITYSFLTGTYYLNTEYRISMLLKTSH